MKWQSIRFLLVFNEKKHKAMQETALEHELTVSEYTWYVCGVVVGSGAAGGSGGL